MHPPSAGTVGMQRHIGKKSHISNTHVASNYSCGLSAGRETEVMNTASPQRCHPVREGFSVGACLNGQSGFFFFFYPGNTTVHFSSILLPYLRGIQI